MVIFQCESTNILDQSKYCFSYPHTISLTMSLLSSGSLVTNYYTVNGDSMTATTLATPTRTGVFAENGSVIINTADTTNALNNLDVIQYNIEDESCEFNIDIATATTITFYRGVNCFTQNALNSIFRIALMNSTLKFDATVQTSESRWFIIKFPPSRTVEFDNATFEFIGNMDPIHDILWDHWGFNVLTRQSNVLLQTQELFGTFIVASFTYAARVESVMHKLYGGLFSFGGITSFGNSSIISDGNPIFNECDPITYISWGDNAISLNGIIFVVTEILRGTSISNGNNSVNVYGSFAQEFPYLSSNIYTNWYVQNNLYFPQTDSTFTQVKAQRVAIYNLLGRLPLEVQLYSAVTTVSTVITIYPGSTSINFALTTFSTITTIIFDGRNETNATFHVRSRGITFSNPTGGAFRFTYINEANSTRMYWTDSRAISVTGAVNVTLDGNFLVNNISLSATRMTIVGSLIAKYVLVNNAATLNVYPFTDGSLTGTIFGMAPSEEEPVVVDTPPTTESPTVSQLSTTLTTVVAVMSGILLAAFGIGLIIMIFNEYSPQLGRVDENGMPEYSQIE